MVLLAMWENLSVSGLSRRFPFNFREAVILIVMLPVKGWWRRASISKGDAA